MAKLFWCIAKSSFDIIAVRFMFSRLPSGCYLQPLSNSIPIKMHQFAWKQVSLSREFIRFQEPDRMCFFPIRLNLILPFTQNLKWKLFLKLLYWVVFWDDLNTTCPIQIPRHFRNHTDLSKALFVFILLTRRSQESQFFLLTAVT